jgi:hypothetical protein
MPARIPLRVRNLRTVKIVDFLGPELCRFLGRLDDEPLHARRREASEKRQGTKSRLVRISHGI